jgi:hypothetical protein
MGAAPSEIFFNLTPVNIFAILFMMFDKAPGPDTHSAGMDKHSTGPDTRSAGLDTHSTGPDTHSTRPDAHSTGSNSLSKRAGTHLTGLDTHTKQGYIYTQQGQTQ